MKKIVCEICASNEFIKEGDYFVCEHCGTKYGPDEVKKMIVEGNVDVSGSSVKIDNSSEVEKYRKLADRHFESGQYQEAYDYYNKIIVDDPDDWEVIFRLGLSKGYCTPYTNYSILDIIATVNNTLEVVEKTINEEERRKQIKKDIALKTFDLTAAIENIGMGNYPDNLDESAANYASLTEYNCIKTVSHIEFLVNDPAYDNDDEIKQFKLALAVAAIEWCSKLTYNRSYISGWSDTGNTYGRVDIPENIYREILTYYDSEVNKVKQENPEYQPPGIDRKNGGCYIATSIYGSYDCPEVWTLRRYRDNNLDLTRHGRAFIRMYYTVSPTFVRLFGDTRLFKAIFRPYLDRKVRKLKANGYSDEPYDDKY